MTPPLRCSATCSGNGISAGSNTRAPLAEMSSTVQSMTPPFAEAKWVRCLRGRVFDVAVDLRRGSPTFLSHCAVELSPEAVNALFIPEGCAHGFQVLEPDSELLYLHTAPYTPDHEGGLRWDDPALDIAWPLAVTDISERDRSHPLLDADFRGIAL